MCVCVCMLSDYGAYASKETRVRRSFARRDQRAHTPAQLLPLAPTVSSRKPKQPIG